MIFDRAAVTAVGTVICLFFAGTISLTNVAIQSRDDQTLAISIWVELSKR